MIDMLQSVLIPEERKAVLIGKKGETKKMIERLTNSRIEINDSVDIYGEGLDVLKAVNIVKAIGRGFSPKTAMLLLDEDYTLHIISLAGENKKTIRRLMARIIGRKGSSKRIIEEMSGCRISVYGKTVAIIGRFDKIGKAVDAVENLLSGKSHGYVYSRLRRM